jgi:hypothetical protein
MFVGRHDARIVKTLKAKQFNKERGKAAAGEGKRDSLRLTTRHESTTAAAANHRTALRKRKPPCSLRLPKVAGAGSRERDEAICSRVRREGSF